MKDSKKMQLWERLALGLIVVLSTSWLVTLASKKTPPDSVSVAWGDFAGENLKESIHPAGDFVIPLRVSSGEVFLRKSFQEESQLGELWSSTEIGAGEVVAFGGGLVLCAEDFGGEWGTVVLILHRWPKENGELLESLYAGLSSLHVATGSMVKEGEVLGTVENMEGAVVLYTELRHGTGYGLGPGKSEEVGGWMSMSRFIEANREVRIPPDLSLSAPESPE